MYSLLLLKEHLLLRPLIYEDMLLLEYLEVFGTFLEPEFRFYYIILGLFVFVVVGEGNSIYDVFQQNHYPFF